jgi:superfamily I DNA/RNA helicase
VVSLFEGPSPEVHVFENEDAEVNGVAGWLRTRLAEGIRPQEIALLVRTVDQMKRAQLARDMSTAGDSNDGAAIAIACMHDAKGSEYRAVAVIACDHDVLPLEARMLAARDEAMLDEIMATERHLLYVAATRAREWLWISGVAPASEYIQDLLSI